MGRKVTNVVDFANLLQCDDVGIETAEHFANQLATAFAAQENVVRRNANRSVLRRSGSRHSMRTYNATVQPQRDAHLTELVFLGRGPIALRCIAVAVVAVACGVAGTLLVRLHQSLATDLAAHMALNPLQTVIANGSSLRTLWPGWVAAVCFAAAVLRLRHGATEPPAGRADVERRTLSQLRSGLRREYTVARVALVVVGLLAAVDVARTAAGIVAAQSGDSTVSSSLPATVVEAAGYAAAALVLTAWAYTFGAEVRRLGAI